MQGVLAIMRIGDEERVLGTVSFSERDASVFLRPVGHAGAVYDYGLAEMPEGATECTFGTAGQLGADERPHVSIHDSGVCHVRAGRDRESKIEAENIGRLQRYPGAHVGSIVCSTLTQIPVMAEVWPDAEAPDADAEAWDVTPPPGTGSVRLTVLVNRNRNRPYRDAYAFREVRRTRADGGSLFVAVNAYGDTASPGDPAVIVLGGWRPTTREAPTSATRFVFVREAAEARGTRL